MIYQPNFRSVPTRLGLYPIVSSPLWVERMLKEGVRTIQLRIKDKQENKVESDVATAISLGHHYNARLFINDYWRLAIKYQAYGVHLGQEDLKNANLKEICEAGLCLGVSTHNDIEIDMALSIRPSYIALGHVFPTKTKKMSSSPQGLKKLMRHVRYLVNYPTVAIGGIGLKHIHAVLATGVGSISLVSAITKAKNWKLATIQLLELIGIGDE